MEIPVSGSGSSVPHQRLRVFVMFQLSTTWLNSTVKGSAPRLLTTRNRIIFQDSVQYIVEQKDMK